jgi:hypothetical protein
VSGSREVRSTAHWCWSSAGDTSSRLHPRFVVQNDAAGDRRQLVVVEEHDPAGAHEPAEIDQVQEDAVEAVVAVDEREVEPPFLG